MKRISSPTGTPAARSHAAAAAPAHRRPAADRVPARSGPVGAAALPRRQRSKPPQRRKRRPRPPSPPTATTAPTATPEPTEVPPTPTPEPPTATAEPTLTPTPAATVAPQSAERDRQLPGPGDGCPARRQGVAHGHDHGRRGRPRGEPGRHLLDPARPVGRHAEPWAPGASTRPITTASPTKYPGRRARAGRQDHRGHLRRPDQALGADQAGGPGRDGGRARRAWISR